MSLETEANLFKAERENTDKSLIAERAKATHSLDTANIKSQFQTDEIVKDERFIADQQMASSRADHDDHREAGAHLVAERRQADRATGLERLRMDETILAERKSAAKLVAKVLEQERIATDRSLLVERTTTDEECVTSSKLLKEEVALHKKTQVTLTSREELLAIVSHDLKNPIGAISAYANLILDDEAGGGLGPEHIRFVKAIKRNSDMSLRLISDLLDLERIAQDKLTMSFAKADAKEIISSALDIFAPLAAEKNIRLAADLPSVPLELECDRDRILQVISNLIGNALKFTPEGGAIDISLREHNGMVEFIVKDDGVGIQKDKQGDIFGRFVQIHSKDKTGLGLGLHIAKTIVELHAGVLAIDSDVGKGSKFYFAIPKGR